MNRVSRSKDVDQQGTDNEVSATYSICIISDLLLTLPCPDKISTTISQKSKEPAARLFLQTNHIHQQIRNMI